MPSSAKLVLLFSLLGFHIVTYAQTNSMPEYNLNKNYPGAEYKFSFVILTISHLISKQTDCYFW
jgi:hypothetical protein